MSALGLGCVKTHTSKNVENKILQRGIRPYVHSIISFHDAHFLQNYPMRAADVGVFTRAGSKADKLSQAKIPICPLLPQKRPNNGPGGAALHLTHSESWSRFRLWWLACAAVERQDLQRASLS